MKRMLGGVAFAPKAVRVASRRARTTREVRRLIGGE
jgi:hypothetical protein